jgi:hypothetical protein
VPSDGAGCREAAVVEGASAPFFFALNFETSYVFASERCVRASLIFKVSRGSETLFYPLEYRIRMYRLNVEPFRLGGS